MSNNNVTHTILIVDSDKKSARSLAALLGDIATIIHAPSGEDALKIAQSKTISLILLEANLPAMDGYATCSRLTDDSRTKNIPVIFVSSKDRDRDIVMGLELGAVDYVTKPFFPQLLKNQVSAVLKQLLKVPKSEKAPLPIKKKMPSPVTKKSSKPTAPPPVTEPPQAIPVKPAPEQKKPAPEQKKSSPEQKKSALEQKKPALEQKKPVPDEKNLPSEEEKTTSEEEKPDLEEEEYEGVFNYSKDLFTTQTGFRIIAAVFMVFAGIAVMRLFDPPDIQKPAPTWKRPSHAASSDTKEKRKKTDMSWLENTKCDPIPDVYWWGTLTHKSMVKYVQRNHKGDWTPYIAKWDRQLLVMNNIFLKNSAAKTKDGTRLEGKDLKAHVDKLQIRLDAILCLADAASKSR